MASFSFTPFPKLSTERLILRPLGVQDEKAIFVLRSDERVSEFITRPKMERLEEAQTFIKKINDGIKKDEWIYWAISLKDSAELMGTVCLWNFSENGERGELGFELLPDFQGKGYMREAVKEIIDFGFKTIKLRHIEAHFNPLNLRSYRLLRHFGFYFCRFLAEEEKLEAEKGVDILAYELERRFMEVAGRPATFLVID